MKYVSAHHSEDDPGGLICQAIEAGPEFRGPAEDVFLAWSLRLEHDAGPAAARLLAAHSLAAEPAEGEAPPATEADRLIALLRQAARFPQDRIDQHLKRRRGGRRGRLGAERG